MRFTLVLNFGKTVKSELNCTEALLCICCIYKCIFYSWFISCIYFFFFQSNNQDKREATKQLFYLFFCSCVYRYLYDRLYPRYSKLFLYIQNQMIRNFSLFFLEINIFLVIRNCAPLHINLHIPYNPLVRKLNPFKK